MSDKKTSIKFSHYRYFFAGLFQHDNKAKFFADINNGTNNIEFTIRNVNYFYKFLCKQDNITLGLFAKKSNITYKPDQTLEEKESPDHIECYVLFNTNTDHEKDSQSQTIYIQQKNKFARDNLVILNEFVKKVSQDISINPINKEIDFWNAIQDKVVKKLTLEICPSNLFGHKNTMVEEANNVREKFKAKRYKQTIESDAKDGLDLSNNTNEIKEGVNYCMSGGGSVLAIGEDNKTTIFDSKDKIRLVQTTIEIDTNNKSETFCQSVIQDFLHKLK